MMYPLENSMSKEELKEICLRAIKRTIRFISTDFEIKQIKNEIINQTSHLDNHTPLLSRIHHIVNNYQFFHCEVCGKEMIEQKNNRCSKKCYDKFKTKSKEQKQKEKLIKNINKFEGLDESLYVECKICGFKAREITSHINKFHKMKIDDYKEQFNAQYVICEDRRKRMMGENNPAYQHNGRLSAWSKNFKNGYNEQRHEDFKKEQSRRMLEIPVAREKNTFCREFYSSDEDYLKAQSRDLSWFQNKYGEEEGEIRWKAKTEKWLKTLSEKSEEEKLEINRKKVYKNGIISKIEMKFVNNLKNNIKELNHQFFLKNNLTSWYIFDIQYRNKIIEFYGDFWHSNPKTFQEDSINPYTKLTAKETWKKDERKILTAQNQGYDVLVIWESDFKNDPQKEIEKCLHFLTQ